MNTINLFGVNWLLKAIMVLALIAAAGCWLRRRSREHRHRWMLDERVGRWVCVCGEKLSTIEEIIPAKHEHDWKEVFPGSSERWCACGDRRTGVSARGASWPL